MNQQIPEPMPHEMVGEIGYDLWVWTARYAPTWLANQPDPETLFRDLNTKVIQTNKTQVEEMMAQANVTEERSVVWDQNLARLVKELHLPAPEVTTPVWDGHSDGIDLDAPPDYSPLR